MDLSDIIALVLTVTCLGVLALCVYALSRVKDISINIILKQDPSTLSEVPVSMLVQPTVEQDSLMKAAQKLQKLFLEDEQVEEWEGDDRP